MTRRPGPTAAAVLCLLPTSPALAEPWIGPGDVAVRHDLQRLSDAGLLGTPLMSWPVTWAQVARELRGLDATHLSDGERAALQRLRARADREMRVGASGLEARLAAAADPAELRTFEATPRETGEATIAADWLGERFAARLAVTLVADPEDDQSVRPDGSYVAGILGNWIVSAGYLDRWWGPGWQGSLILSTNARPLPAIGLDRNEPVPFDVPVLRWLGPWKLSTFMGQLESDRDYSNALLFGLRAEFRPHPTLQVAASRAAQWCGDGRPCGLDTFWDLLVGNDNDQALEEQPGNQLGGFDLRWSWPGARVPIALYAQAIGEDEAGFMPSKFLGLFGLEVWGDAWEGTVRAHLEYADTACDFPNSPPEFGCAYTSGIYTSGYRYRGRAIGHSADADSEALGAGIMYLTAEGRRWDLVARNVKLNRAGLASGHSLSPAAETVRDFALTHDRAYAWGKITVSVGYSDPASNGPSGLPDGVRGFLTWRQALR